MTTGDLDESFLTVAEVAETLKLNQQTVRNWIDQGSLPALRIGRRVRIRRSDFERLLSEGYTAGAARISTGPSAEDFWGGEPVGVPEPAAGAGATAPAPDPDPDPDPEPVAGAGATATATSPEPVAGAGATAAATKPGGAGGAGATGEAEGTAAELEAREPG